MTNKTITRVDLSEAIYNELGLSRKDTTDLLEMVLDEISNSLSKGESVKLTSFGTFSIREKKPRVGRNPKTGKEAVISERRVLTFKASQSMKKRINEVKKNKK